MDDAIQDIFMHRALQLARLGAGSVAPNPMVGAVLVHDGRIIGEGFHRQYGQAHAEVNCIADATAHHAGKITSSTMYVSLEPCAHYGKTPPCADLIIAHKIPRVVVGCKDLFAKVNGAGIAKLKAAGVEVIEGVLENECRQLNKRFFTFHQYKRPYIILKWAQTADGFMAAAGNDRLLISNALTNRLVHRWRSEEAAIMVGANTAIQDDPLLDTRNWYGKAPVKIVADPRLRVPGDRRMFRQGADCIIVNTVKQEQQQQTQFLQVDKVDFLSAMLSSLYQQNIQSVLVEGGQRLLQSFIDAGLWDETRVITNTGLTIGMSVGTPVTEPLEAPDLRGAIVTGTMQVDTDQITFFKHKDNHFL